MPDGPDGTSPGSSRYQADRSSAAVHFGTVMLFRPHPFVLTPLVAAISACFSPDSQEAAREDATTDVGSTGGPATTSTTETTMSSTGPETSSGTAEEDVSTGSESGSSESSESSSSDSTGEV